MLDQLQILANTLYCRFGFGRPSDLNLLADSIGSGLLLFHEGYFDATPRVLSNGTFQESYNLSLLLLTPASIQDAPEQKRANYEVLHPTYQELFLLLDSLGTISNQRATMNLVINITDRVFDGIRLTLTLTTEPVNVCGQR